MTYSSIDKQKLLTRNILFKKLALNDVDNIVALSTEIYFTNNQIIFQKGDVSDSLLAVLNGQVRISTSSMNGKEIVLNTISPGEMFGEIAFIDGRERSATATAIGDCALLSIRHDDYMPLLKSNPEIAIELLIILCKKVRDTSDRVEAVGLQPVPVSLARLLVRASKEMGKETVDGLYLDWKKSQQEIGYEIGTSRESINKQLNSWKKQGLLTLGGQSLSITILDIEALDIIAKGYI
ncbi:MAG: Crp/Fnr family transcriptional regulator [Methylococcales bacterium]